MKKNIQSLLILVLLFAFLTRVFRLHIPQRYIFDEVYHGVTAKLIARNDSRAFEWWNTPVEKDTAVDWLHPPLAKYTQAFFILIFGENSYGWRFSSAVFGVGVVFLVYKLADELFEDEWLALLAAFLSSLDGLLLTQSRIAMNDIHVTFFILLSLWLYWKYHKHKKEDSQKLKLLGLTSLSLGMAIASKWSGMFAIGIVGFSEATFKLRKLAPELKKKKPAFKKILLPLKKLVAFGLVIILIPATVYLVSYTQMFLQGKDFSHFVELHRQIWTYQTTLDATHDYQSRPLQWFLNLRPVWYHVDYISQTQIANIYAFGNPAIQYFGAVAVIISLGGMWLGLVKKPELYFLLGSYFIVWLPWILSPRIMFYYHYTPAVPLMAILLAYWLRKLWSLNKIGQRLSIGVIAICCLFFLAWFPQWTALPVSQTYANKVYYFLSEWK